MTATPEQLEAVLQAALRVLEARHAEMLTVEEWVGLARAVAAANGGKTANLLTDRDLENIVEYQMEWDEATDGPLPDLEGD